MSATTNLRLPFLDPNQNQKSVTHNAALQMLDVLVQLAVQSTALQAPPAAPADGQCWIVASGGTGAWAGHDLNVAAWQDGAWSFYAPNPGTVAWVEAPAGALVWTGAAWAPLIGAASSLSLAALGIGTAADPSNPFSALLDAALFSARPTSASPAGTGDVRVTLNKGAPANTASLLFQDGFSGRAEVGLCGDDGLHFKVSFSPLSRCYRCFPCRIRAGLVHRTGTHDGLPHALCRHAIRLSRPGLPPARPP